MDDVDMEPTLPENSKHIVLIGASNMKKLIPLLYASGYTVTDLTYPSWLATPSNVMNIVEKLNSLDLSPGYTMVMELFGKCTFRYEQFDGTMALPFKYGSGYHMEGKIGVYDDDSFIRLANSLDSLYTHGNPEIKLFIPPPATVPIFRML
jgi:hypothetical protein